MTTPNPSFNPMLTTTAGGLFKKEALGMVQGFMMPDPATRFALAQGTVSEDATEVMWGGYAVSLAIAPDATGPIVSAASAASNINGFIVTNQAANGITTPSSAPQQYGALMSAQFVRKGSGARVCVNIDPTFAASIIGGTTSESVDCSWDFVNQRIVPYAPAYSDVTISDAVWANTSGGRTTFTVDTDLTSVLSAGDIIEVSGVVSTGGTGEGFNGSFVVVSTSSSGSPVVNTVVVTQASSSSVGTYSSGGTIAAGGGALGVKIVRVNVGNSMTIVAPDTDNNLAWDQSSSCAEIIV